MLCKFQELLFLQGISKGPGKEIEKFFMNEKVYTSADANVTKSI